MPSRGRVPIHSSISESLVLLHMILVGDIRRSVISLMQMMIEMPHADSYLACACGNKATPAPLCTSHRTCCAGNDNNVPPTSFRRYYIEIQIIASSSAPAWHGSKPPVSATVRAIDNQHAAMHA